MSGIFRPSPTPFTNPRYIMFPRARPFVHRPWNTPSVRKDPDRWETTPAIKHWQSLPLGFARRRRACLGGSIAYLGNFAVRRRRFLPPYSFGLDQRVEKMV
ncbi:hypothetical protein Cob_v003200 [Colletotrichum orbiculare MAFF 240422]|uniref:Uncharacterized protein n=1 Tax=Colletotrichum orbiculare (strain 104-T / ATCC 96160 / CBS 514.97 / LARS 414 / MAFF 240422) TaxID=1213857 RepID=A0A484G278_COLOR|nr:hypothetical protein Cob_v003200 [Colletotrichum orbiculare MAFF 240422]